MDIARANLPSRMRAVSCLLVCTIGITVAQAAVAADISDVFGVRSNSNPASLTPNVTDFHNNLVDDVTLMEGSGEFDRNFAGDQPLNVITFVTV